MARLQPILPLVESMYQAVRLAPRGEARVTETLQMFRLLSKHDLDFRADVFKALARYRQSVPVGMVHNEKEHCQRDEPDARLAQIKADRIARIIAEIRHRQRDEPDRVAQIMRRHRQRPW